MKILDNIAEDNAAAYLKNDWSFRCVQTHEDRK